MIGHLRLGLYAAALSAALGAGWKVRDWQADAADLKREQAAAAQMAAIQKGMDLAAQETEKRLAVAARTLAATRGDADRVRDLASRVAASAEASERDRERIASLSRLVAESARVVEEGIERVGTLDARLAGCQLAP